MIVSLKRCEMVIGGVQVGGHRMLTFGSERCGVRVTMGRLDRHGEWHPRRPDVFVLWAGRRRSPELRYELGKRLDNACLSIAARLPARLRVWTVVDATNTARRLYPDPSGYAGPDGLGYKQIYDGARRER